MVTRRCFLTASVAAALTSFGPFSHAQVTQKTARIISGFPPGGATDVVARFYAEKLRGSSAPTVIVENKPGAGGRIALEQLKASQADGSVSVLTPSSLLVVYPYVYKKLGYDPFKDFAPVSTCALVEFALTVGPAVPESVKTLADFVKWAKANPQQAAYSSPAAGAAPHFVGAMFGRAAGIEFNHVPYKGDAPGIQDLIGGQIASSVNVIGAILPQAKAGKLRILATSGPKRSRFLPDVPTFVEAGYQDVEAQDFFGFLVPAKTPPETVNAFAAAVAEVVKTTDISKRLAELAFETSAIPTKEFAALLKAEYERWGPIVKATGFTLDE